MFFHAVFQFGRDLFFRHAGMQDLQYILQYYEAGESVEVTVYRPNDDRNGYEEQTFEITLGDRAELQ